MDYPIWDIPIGRGVLIGAVSIIHVIVSHFAVGGGLLLAILETVSVRRGDRPLRDLCQRGSKILILLSTVFGAISGVAIWFTIGLVHPTATSTLIHTFVWGWAIEWAFFILEIATALAWAATWGKVRPATHLLLIWLYAFAAFMSLVVIQGIISFMLTPGRWVSTRSFLDGFLNPSYLPGLVLRTGICIFLAGAYLVLAALREKDPAERRRLVRILSAVQVAGILLAYGSYRWWEAILPASVSNLFRGAKPLIVGLGGTRRLILWSLALYLVLVVLGWLLPKLYRTPVAVVALLVAFTAFGSYERLREGVRKPFVIRDFMFSNGVTIAEIPNLNESGILSKAKWADRGAAAAPLSKGEAVYRAECASCHTIDHYLGLRKIAAGNDADTFAAILGVMREDGLAYQANPELLKDGHVLTEKLSYPQMAPFVGTDEELAALAEWLARTLAEPVAPKGAEVTR
jgi:mono/diheme cytochrome c family protein